MTLAQRGLRKLLIWETQHPVFTLFLALTLSALSILYTVRNLEFQTAQLDLISPKNRLVQLSDAMSQFEDLDTLVVVIENPNNSRSLNFLHALVSVLERDRENYVQIFWRLDPQLFRPWALLYLDKKDLLTLRDRLKEHRGLMERLSESPRLTHFFRLVNEEMSSRMVRELFTGFLNPSSPDPDREPFDLAFLTRFLQEMRHWLDGDQPRSSSWKSLLIKKTPDDEAEEGYFFTEDKRYRLLFVTPVRMEKSFAKSQQSLKALREAIATVQRDFPGIKVGVTGQEALNADEMSLALHDMSLATVLSLLGLTLLLILFWRGLRRPVLEMITLLVALCLTFGLTTLFIGHLNILSISFAPMLLGLGIDYGIHWFARYQEELRTRGPSKREAIGATMMKLGPGILLAGFSAALSFFPLALSGFKGLAELGIICSMGMVVATGLTLCLLPALILLFDKSEGPGQISAGRTQIKPLLNLSGHRNVALVGLMVTGFCFSLWGTGKVKFDLNLLKLQSKGAESVLWEKRLVESSGRASIYGVILARSFKEVEEKMRALEVLPTVSEVLSVRSLLPSEQEEKIDFLRQMKPLLRGIGSFEIPESPVDLIELDNILGRIRFKMMDSDSLGWDVSQELRAQMKQVGDLIDQLRQRFHSTERSQLLHALQAFEKAFIRDLNDKLDLFRANMDTKPMELRDLPKSLMERFVGKDQLYFIRVFSAKNIWEPELLGQFVQDLQTVDPDVIGDPITLYVFTKAFRDACIKAALYASVFIFFLLLVTFRSFASTLMAMLPLMVGTAWTFGLMYLFGVNLNLANSIFLPLVVGAGVEYGILIVQRWRQGDGKPANPVLPRSTGVGIILASLTTTVGFGSLTISKHQGIHSLGLLTTIGSLSILAAAILFLPGLLQLLRDLQSLKRKDGPVVNRVRRSPYGEPPGTDLS